MCEASSETWIYMCGICLENCPASSPPFHPEPELSGGRGSTRWAHGSSGRCSQIWQTPEVGSMYGIYRHLLDFYGNVGKYIMHGSYGYMYKWCRTTSQFAQGKLNFMFHSTQVLIRKMKHPRFSPFTIHGILQTSVWAQIYVFRAF